MKKTVSIILAAASLAACIPALSGCNCSGKVKFTLSEEGGKHYIISFSGLSSPRGEYEIPAYYGADNIPVTEIAEEGFSSTRFSKIIIPETVEKIGVMAFGYCRELETVEFAEGIGLESFSRAMFANCAHLQSIKIPDSVRVLDAYAFSGCGELSLVDLASVESIGYGAFKDCTALEQVSLPDTLTTIGEMAFYCSGLKSVDIPHSVHDIVTDGDDGESTVRGLGMAAFLGCSDLERANIGNGVKIIPPGAFGSCRSLKEVFIPLSVEELCGAYYQKSSIVYGHAFYGCTALTDIYFEGEEEQWKSVKIDYTQYSSSINNDPVKNAKVHYNCEK